MTWGGWAGIECDVVLANADEASESAAGKGSIYSGLWSRAVFLPSADGYLLVAPAEPLPAKGSYLAGVRIPGETMVISDADRSLLWSLLTDDRAWNAFVQRLRSVSRPVVLAAQVWSSGVVELVNRLEEEGVAVERDRLPSIAGGSVAYWNSKIGGRELATAVLSHDLLPPASVCNTLGEVAALVVGRPDEGFVVKPNVGAGGSGIHAFAADEDRDGLAVVQTLESLGRTATAAGQAGKAFHSMSGPFLVEELVGSWPTTGRIGNRSPTADFYVDSQGLIHEIGVVEQILEAGTAYRGSQHLSRLPDQVDLAIVEAGRALGVELYKRGYVGLYNVDFVLDPHDRLWFVELNVRQSAPLDQILTLERLHGGAWHQRFGFHMISDPLHGHDELPSKEGNWARTAGSYDGTFGEAGLHIFPLTDTEAGIDD